MTISDMTQLRSELDPSLVDVFPPDFQWGASTSSYQIEGATHEDGRSLSIWDVFATTPGAVYQRQNGNIADDHYHRMRDDVALMARLGIRSYRFSVAWPRIIPDGAGATNPPGIAFYDRLVDVLLEHDIEPTLTLYHWDLPLCLHDRGGWLSRNTALAFAEYAHVVSRQLGDRVKRWITINEPYCAAYLGYGSGLHAPGLRDPQSAFIAGHHLLLAHGLAVQRIRQNVPDAQAGISLDLSPVYGADDLPETLSSMERLDRFKNRWFLDPIFRGKYPDSLFAEQRVAPPPIQDGDLAIISVPTDFLGVNYYQRSVVSGDPDNPGSVKWIYPVPGSSYTNMSWEVFPKGLTELLLRLHRDYSPQAILVTENGASYDDDWDGGDHISDPERQHYLVTHIEAIAHALEEGVPVQGYFVWSLMDNFEWSEGYSKRFGLVYIDYPTQQRIVKDSGHWYRDFLAQAPGPDVKPVR
ncbi:MAG: GH1 family beta-glucosidase [Ktedonobacterales bacterium]